MCGPAHVRGVVTARRDLTPELWIVHIRPEKTIPFEAGQYVTIGLPGENRLVERPYSVASAPEDPELEFLVELVRGGKLTPHLYDVPVGGEVYIRRSARGRFVLDERSGNRNHFMAATVTGIAPFSAMVRHLAARERQGRAIPYRLAILHAASVSAELGYGDELAAEALRRSWLEYVPTISRAWLDPSWPGERGRVEDVARKHLDALHFGPGSTTVYLCGNPYMIRQMKAVLERAGFDRGSVKEETYWPPD